MKRILSSGCRSRDVGLHHERSGGEPAGNRGGVRVAGSDGHRLDRPSGRAPRGAVVPEPVHSSSRLRSSRNWATASSSTLPPAGLAVAFAAAGGRGRFLGGDRGAWPAGRPPAGWRRYRRRRRPRRIRSRIPPRRPDGDGVDDGGIAGLARPGRDAGRGHRLPERGHAEGHRADGQLIADLQGLLAEDPLAVDERPVGAAQVAHGQLALGLVDLAVPAAHLRRLDPDDAVIVSPEAGHAIGQLQRRRGTAAPDDLKYIVHRN